MHIQNGISGALTASISINAQLFFSIFMLLFAGHGFWLLLLLGFFNICMLIQRLKDLLPKLLAW